MDGEFLEHTTAIKYVNDYHVRIVRVGSYYLICIPYTYASYNTPDNERGSDACHLKLRW